MKKILWWANFKVFFEKIASCVCLLLVNLYLVVVVVVLILWTTENRYVLPAKNFNVEIKLPNELLMYSKKNNSPRIDPCGTPASTGNQSDFWPYNNILWYLFRTLLRSFSNKPKILTDSSSSITSTCQTLFQSFRHIQEDSTCFKC